MKRAPSPRYSGKKVVRYWGGPTKIIQRLNDAGYNLTIKAANQWVYRDSIGVEWVLVLAEMSRKEDRVFHEKLEEYRKDTPDHARRKLKQWPLDPAVDEFFAL